MMVIDLRDGMRPVSLPLAQNATRVARTSRERTGARLQDSSPS